MQNRHQFLRGCLAAAAFAFLSIAVFAQTSNVQPRITAAINESQLTTLRGNTHPYARPQFDRGAAPDSLPMQRMLLVLKRSAAQEAALDTLMEQQQDQSSPNYHAWLTPQQFGQQFGPADADIQTITSWLESEGFTVNRVSNGRTVIEFSGTAGQVRAAFHTEIHRYNVNNEDHWANSSDPQIPTALTPVVAGIDSLYNFPRHTMHHMAGVVSRSKATGKLQSANPLFTLGGNCGVPGLSCYGVTPYDFATIYNVLPLWNATPAADGTGETIAIVAETDIAPSDISSFRNYFALPANTPTIILDGPDPGTVQGDETESDLDVEWSGAVAKGAAIDVVTSETTEASLGVDLSAQYVVDNNLAPILSESYGICELFLGSAGNQFYDQLWQQAAAQGITALVATGDSGSAVCDRNTGNTGAAQLGLSVNGISSTPYNVAVGGTDFFDLTNVSTYWSPNNTVPPGAPTGTPATLSALSYIPETTWNDSCTNAVFGNLLGYSTNAETNCNNPQLTSYGFVTAVGGSGGKSNCTTSNGTNQSSCAGGYPKPAWQAGTGVPSDGKRDVPDVSLFAASGSPSGAFYLICEADGLLPGETSCDSADSGTHFLAVGGTSASTPAFAGIMALVDQKTGSRQGNANYILYKLAAQSGATCNSSNGAGTNCSFYDVTNGTIAMPCVKGSPNCTTSISGDTVGVLSGYATASGYDLATGLGSVNANNLVSAWTAANTALKASTTTLTLNNGSAVNITHGQSVPVTIAVTGTGGTPTGNVSLIASTGPDGTEGVQGFILSSGSAAGTTNALPGGSYTVAAKYGGDATFAESKSSGTAVTVAPEASKVAFAYELFDPTTGLQTNPNATTAVYGTPPLLRINVTSQAGDACATNAPGSSGCPTGKVTLTDNYNSGGSSPLDGGTFSLNSQGYTEDQAIDLQGGTHVLAASYGGDGSFNGSSGTDSITITKAPTTTKAIFNPVPQSLVIGGPSGINGMTNSQSVGDAPTGNFTVLDGSATVGTSGVLGFAGSPSRGANCQALIDFSIGPPSGQHTLTVQYSGDNNYAGSTSAPVTINAVYPVVVSVTANPTSIIYGDTVTVTATVDTNNPASNAALKPTGTLSLSSTYGSITGVTTTVTHDASGNWMLQATATTTPQQSEYISANYSGDPNYEGLGSSNLLYITVTIPDFTVSANPPSLIITAGQTGMTTLTVTPTTSYKSTVALSCGGIGYVVSGTTCNFSPSSVTLANNASATTTFSLSTPAPSGNTTAMDAPTGMRGAPLASIDRGTWWTLGALSGLASFLLFATSGKRHRYCGLGLALLCGLSFAAGCGGGGNGGGGGGGGGGGNEPAATTTTLSTPTTKVAPGAGLTLTATVNSTKPTTGTVTFSSQSCVFTAFETLANGTAQVQLAPTVGICDVTAKYGGDANNLPSQSGALEIEFTGTTVETVDAQTGPETHPIPVNVTLQ